MNDPFHATIKMTSGEEVLAQVVVTEENGVEFFLVVDPIIISENTTIDHERGVVISGLTPRKWLMYSNDDMVIVHKDKVITITEMDSFGIEFYERALLSAKASAPIKKKVEPKKHIGYLGNIGDNRKHLEDCFKLDTHDTTEQTD